MFQDVKKIILLLVFLTAWTLSSFGQQTSNTIPVVTTISITSITTTLATINAEVNNQGGGIVAERGVVWSTSGNPTVNNNRVASGSGTGNYSVNVTGLTGNNKYFVRAYAINNYGIAYGGELTFTTLVGLATLTTNNIITQSIIASSGGNITDAGGSSISSRGVVWGTSSGPTIAGNKTTDGTGLGYFVSNLTGLTPLTNYYLRAYAINNTGTAYGNELTFTTTSTSQIVTDIDGNTYNTVQIGNQIWMRENLKTTRYRKGGSIPYVVGNADWQALRTGAWSNYDHNAANDPIYGKLYNWYTTLGDTLCPTGWGVPTNAEWTTLTTYLGGESVAGGKMKAVGTTYWNSPNTAATNESSFSVLPGGYRDFDGSFLNIRSNAFFWSATENAILNFYAWSRNLYDNNGNVLRYSNYYYKPFGASIRCIKDSISTTTARIPTISTIQGTEITSISAKSGGNITSDGGASITNRGVVWSTSTNPTISLTTKTSDGTGTGTFLSSLTSLSPNTTYYVRAYATNSDGTGYGNEITFKTSTPVVLPIVNTVSASSVTTTTVTSGGNIISDGGSSITNRGVVWSTSPNPTISLSTKTSDGTGTGSFSSSLTGLSPNTIYYLRAYATNSFGTSYGNEFSFTTATLTMNIPCPGVCTVKDIDGNTYNTVQIGTQCWTKENLKVSKYNDGTTIPLDTSGGIDGNGIGQTWGGLTTGARTVYEHNATILATYGYLYNWYAVANTKGLCPSGWHVPTDKEWTALTTQLGGEPEAGGKLKQTGATLWRAPNTGADNTSGFTSLPGGYRIKHGSFSSIRLNAKFWSSSEFDNTYVNYPIYRQLASYHGNVENSYSGDKSTGSSVRCLRDSTSTTTGSIPTISTIQETEITSISAKSGGNITSDGEVSITKRGVVWSTSTNPTISLSTKTSDGIGLGTFFSNLTNLSPQTTYFIRAYATNCVGTGYGNEFSFKTTATNIPTILTIQGTEITSISAKSGGNITSDGEASITKKGVVWSTSPNPTISLSTKTSDGTGSGTFVSNLTNLSANTTYYLRAYATNSAGTGYGNEFSFKTSTANIPTISTIQGTEITSISAKSGGNITSDWGASISNRGVVWSTSPNPTISLSTKTSDGTGSGTFVSNLTNLSPNTTYYLSAYATNSAGTGYGNELTFKTTANITMNIPCPGTPTVKDIDGNIYNTVQIGTQCWTKENLKVSKYNDGTTIPLDTSGGINGNGTGQTWDSRLTGARTIYANDNTNLASYGYLYNWYAAKGISTSLNPNYQNICPSEWHVPSDGEFTTLIDFLGGPNVAGGKMKTTGTTYWSFINYRATNESGFSVLPGGETYNNGSYINITRIAKLWSATENTNTASAYFCLLSGGNEEVGRYSTNSYHGASIRCIRDSIISSSSVKITTTKISSTTATSAISGGTITSDDGINVIVISRGVCWNLKGTPTIQDAKTIDGSGFGNFSSSMRSLQPNTLYYIRAYANTTNGTFYGDEFLFKTSPKDLNAVVFYTPNVNVTCDTIVEIPLLVHNFKGILGTQGSINWDATKLKYEGISSFGPASLNLTLSDFGITEVQKGKLSFIWNASNSNAITLADSTSFFIIKFKLINSQETSTSVKISNDPIGIELLNSNYEKINYEIGNYFSNQSCTKVSGKIQNPKGLNIPGVTLSLSNNDDSKTASTDVMGDFSFTNLSMANYSLIPSKLVESNPRNGISIFDLALIQAHIIGKKPLETAYQIIAADVNGSSTITIADIIMLKRFILGSESNFNGKLYSFVDKKHIFSNPKNPFPFPQSIIINITQNLVIGDFIGVKLGDINFDNIPRNFVSKENRNRKIEFLYEIVLSDLPNKSNEFIYRIKSAKEQDLLGMQFTLNWDSKLANLVAIENNPLGIDFANVSVSNGLLGLSWTSTNGLTKILNENEVVLEIRLKLKSKFNKPALNMNDELLEKEAFDDNFNFKELSLKLENNLDANDLSQYKLFVFPNPAQNNFTLTFNSNKAEKGFVQVTDMLGRLIINQEVDIIKGLNNRLFNIPDHIVPGIYNIQLRTSKNFETLKLLLKNQN